MACTCVSCADCDGTGDVWFSLSGKYLGNCHSDDMDSLESCDTCEGTGIIETCVECLEAEEQAIWEDEQAS